VTTTEPAPGTPPRRRVIFHLDFVSPYTWLALVQAERFGHEHGIAWEPRPVVYAALLEAHGLVGPVETPAKRRYTFADVARCAHRLGVRLTGPPAHPFRSLEALRTLCLFRHDPRALSLAVRLSDACWGHGRALTDPDVLREIVADAGLDATDLASRIAVEPIKRELRELTEQAVRDGVFGVPTFAVDDELFWGADRLELLGRYLAGRLPPARELVGPLLDRPSGADRRR
jgi:2-hydroxychromene-2-carboxylate isomerase